MSFKFAMSIAIIGKGCFVFCSIGDLGGDNVVLPSVRLMSVNRPNKTAGIYL